MYIDSAAIITIASVLGALTAIGAVAYKIIKWFQAQEKQTTDIEDLKKQEKEDIKAMEDELCLLTYAVLACLKELSSKAHSDPASVSKGDIVTFTGGGVYKSSTAEYASVQKNVTSTCKVTAVNTKGTHPYHCISQDGKGVYGWVNAADVK